MYGLIRQICDSALFRIMPAIEHSMARDFKRKDFHIVVGNPFVVPGSITEQEWVSKGILFEKSYGKYHTDWEVPFDEIARSKAYLSWLYQMPTQHLQTRCPHLLQPGDTLYYGSAVEDRLVVAVSGFQPYFDGMVSEWMLSAIRAECIHNAETSKTEGHFVP